VLGWPQWGSQGYHAAVGGCFRGPGAVIPRRIDLLPSSPWIGIHPPLVSALSVNLGCHTKAIRYSFEDKKHFTTSRPGNLHFTPSSPNTHQTLSALDLLRQPQIVQITAVSQSRFDVLKLWLSYNSILMAIQYIREPCFGSVKFNFPFHFPACPLPISSWR
jgi:hypothetical protein